MGVLLICSCSSNKGKEYIHLVGDVVENIQMASGDEVSVPYTEEGGVKLIDVMINGAIKVKMIVDSGCSDMLIFADEANFLYKQGAISESDITGINEAAIADGSIVETMGVNLKEVVVGDKLRFTNVEASVSNSCNAPLLLGNSFLDRIATYKVDTKNKVITFTID